MKALIDAKLKETLDFLLSLPAETEWLEFKQASNTYAFDKIGRYFSALSNEARLKNQEAGWLIFGIQDRSHKVVGSNFRPHRDGLEKDYHHFGPPFLLNSNRLFGKIRNLTYRYMRDNTLFPTEITQYDSWVIRELLHNCIAHQDYSMQGRITVVEEESSLLFSNLGSFLPQSVENVISFDAPPEYYRNQFLADAMVNLQMIDTIGSGIKRVFSLQRNRFFPMPDYDLLDPHRVKVRLSGKILDENYTRLLMSKTDLALMDVIALDKVQKKIPLSADEFARLKRARVIEGRRPNLFVAARIAEATQGKADYIRLRAFDKEHYKQMVLSLLKKFGPTRRKEIDRLLLEKLPDILTQEQKYNKIRNLLQEMKKEGKVCLVGGPGPNSRWAVAGD